MSQNEFIQIGKRKIGPDFEPLVIFELGINHNGSLNLNPSSVFCKPLVTKNNLIKIKSAATGFMLFTKKALKRIQKDVKTFYLPGDNKEQVLLYNYFDCCVVDNDYLTEDYYFSYLYRKNGGEIWADKRISLKHHGTHCYGSL